MLLQGGAGSRRGEACVRPGQHTPGLAAVGAGAGRQDALLRLPVLRCASGPGVAAAILGLGNILTSQFPDYSYHLFIPAFYLC